MKAMKKIKKLKIFRMEVPSDMWLGKACVRTWAWDLNSEREQARWEAREAHGRLPEAEISLGDSRTESKPSSEAAESEGRVRRKGGEGDRAMQTMQAPGRGRPGFLSELQGQWGFGAEECHGVIYICRGSHEAPYRLSGDKSWGKETS